MPQLVHRQYTSFPSDRFCQMEMKNPTRLSNKTSNARSCADDQILENKNLRNMILYICTGQYVKCIFDIYLPVREHTWFIGSGGVLHAEVMSASCKVMSAKVMSASCKVMSSKVMSASCSSHECFMSDHECFMFKSWVLKSWVLHVQKSWVLHLKVMSASCKVMSVSCKVMSASCKVMSAQVMSASCSKIMSASCSKKCY